LASPDASGAPAAGAPDARELARLRANVSGLSWLNASHMFLLLMPVAVPFYRSHGLTMQEIFVLQALFSGATLVFEVPSGYAADLLGRKRSLVAGAVLYGAAFSWLAFARGFAGFAIFEVVAAAGIAFFSGTDLALLYASLERLPEGTAAGARAVGRFVSSAQLGETAAALLGGALALVSLQLPAQVGALAGWAPLAIALTLHEPAGPRAQGRHGENARVVWRALFRASPFVMRLSLATMLYSTASILAVWSFQMLWTEQGIALVHFGWLWAAQNGVVALAARYAHRVDDAFGLSTVIVAVVLLPIAGYLGMGGLAGWAAVCAGLCFPLCRALNSVVLRDALNARLPGELRATANSVLALGMRLLFALAGPLLGAAIDRVGAARALGATGVVFAAVALASGGPLLAAWRHERAAQGLTTASV
jgi:MFS family permease